MMEMTSNRDSTENLQTNKDEELYLPASYFQEGLPLWEEAAVFLQAQEEEEGWVHLPPFQRASGPAAQTVWSSLVDPAASCTTTK